MDWSEFNIVKKHLVECDQCGWYSWEIVKTVNTAGIDNYRYACQGCDRLVPKFIKIKNIEEAGYDLDSIPHYGGKKRLNVCEVCKVIGAELHHWAPHAYFGIESWDWPMSYLCRKCHMRWHSIVTPNISQR